MNAMDIKVLSTGCCHCQTLEEHVHAAVDKIGVDASVDTVEDIWMGIGETPA